MIHLQDTEGQHREQGARPRDCRIKNPSSVFWVTGIETRGQNVRLELIRIIYSARWSCNYSFEFLHLIPLYIVHELKGSTKTPYLKLSVHLQK